MKPQSSSKQAHAILLVIDQKGGRELYAAALQFAGFLVSACDTEHALSLLTESATRQALVILSCPYMGVAEMQLVKQILSYCDHLLVLCELLPITVMRKLFLWGVDDVTDQPQNPADLANIVKNLLDSLVPKNSYQAVERTGIA
jgi:DNA-binding NtrC family response regulator